MSLSKKKKKPPLGSNAITTIRRRLNQVQLFGRVARKKLLVHLGNIWATLGPGPGEINGLKDV